VSDPAGYRRWAAPVATCAACGRERTCYHATSARPLCRSCYRRENKSRWNIGEWVKPVAVCSRCGSEGPAWFAKTPAPLCDSCHTRQRPRSPPQTVLAACEHCERERTLERTAEGRWLCRTCLRDRYDRQWTQPVVTCTDCGQQAPGYGARGERPVCASCRRRELAAARLTPYRLPVAVCSECGQERECQFATSERPVCLACRWRGHLPPVDTCRVCGVEKPCHNAATEHAVCRACKSRRHDPRESCLTCGQLRRVCHRPAGRPECEACATARLSTRVDCCSCARVLRVAASDPERCEYCAGEQPLRGCRRCGEIAANYAYDDGWCSACALPGRVAGLRDRADPAALGALEPLLAALEASPNPEATVRWLRLSPARHALRGLLEGTVDISHEALDSAGDHVVTLTLRDRLIATSVLAPRLEQTATFQRAAGRLLDRVADSEQRTQLRAFATWQLQHQLLRRERRGLTTRSSARHETGLLRAAVKLTLWAQDEDVGLAELTQADLDAWITTAPSARRTLGDFLDWSTRASLTTTLVLPARSTHTHAEQLPDQQRLELVHRLLDDEHLDLRDRVGGLLVLLLAQPVSRLLLLSAEHVDTNAKPVTLRLDHHPLELPAPVGELVAELARQAADRTLQPQTQWLFPGRRHDAPLTSSQLRLRLRRLDIPVLSGRTSALLALAATLPPAILADLLAISEGGAANWSRLAAGDWNAYAAHAARRYHHADD
jgi:hypothetical protein